MEKLYPIIRRRRRPLVEENPLPVKPEDKGPKTAEEKAITEPAETVTPKQPRENVAKK